MRILKRNDYDLKKECIMNKFILTTIFFSLVLFTTACSTNKTNEAPVASSQNQSNESVEHEHSHEQTKASQGIFEDSEVKDRELSDWEGSWKSIYPYLVDGSLDEVFEKKAKDGDKTFEEYKEYYKEGYQTDINSIDINKGIISFHMNDKWETAEYNYDGYEILTYESGKKGVRYLFSSVENNSKAPKFIQFSDHIIEPQKSGHFHIYMGNESHKELLSEMTNWPTYFPESMSKKDIIHDMLYH